MTILSSHDVRWILFGFGAEQLFIIASKEQRRHSQKLLASIIANRMFSVSNDLGNYSITTVPEM